MNNSDNISICIPSYERTKYLKRLLDSIEIQTFKNFEIIITDDSISDNNKKLVESYSNLNINYFQNKVSLGSPKNWNYAISKASYSWIKIMHDDDFFRDQYSLEYFANSINKNKEVNFIFSSHLMIDENNNKLKRVDLNLFEIFILRKTRSILFHKNYIGHPSCVMFKKYAQVEFDNTFKWVVDIEFYYRYLNKHNQLYFIKDALVVISNNDTQITKNVFRNKDVEIPENHLLINKIGERKLNNIIIFDYYWRLYRNLHIDNDKIIENYGITCPATLVQMIKFQKNIHRKLLNNGLISKAAMIVCYFYTADKRKNAKN